MENQKFYEVTFTVSVKRRVLASSEQEALDKVPYNQMLQEIQEGDADEDWTVEAVDEETPSITDVMDDLAEQLVRGIYTNPFNKQVALYKEIQDLNAQLVQQGKPAYQPFILNRLTHHYMQKIEKALA